MRSEKRTDTSIILITHDLGVVAQIAENVMVMYAGQAVEYADVKSIFKEPLHPYTRGLLKSLPVLGEEKDELYSIKGNIPSPKDYPQGCRFSRGATRLVRMQKGAAAFDGAPGRPKGPLLELCGR